MPWNGPANAGTGWVLGRWISSGCWRESRHCRCSCWDCWDWSHTDCSGVIDNSASSAGSCHCFRARWGRTGNWTPTQHPNLMLPAGRYAVWPTHHLPELPAVRLCDGRPEIAMAPGYCQSYPFRCVHSNRRTSRRRECQVRASLVGS